MTWNDTRLAWDPLKFNNLTEITLPFNKVWVIINYKVKSLQKQINYSILYYIGTRYSTSGTKI
jgi:hypothetical protein